MISGSRLKVAVLLIILAASFVPIVSFLRGSSEERVWGVAVTGLPEKVAAEQADEDVPLYILKQTHEPLLRSDDGQNYTSKILSSWHRSADSSLYSFCPAPEARFDENNPLSLALMAAHLKTVTDRFGGKFSIKSGTACVAVQFGKSRRGYMRFLSMYENSPTIKKTAVAELGLGAFRVAEINRDYIRLERKKYCRNGYNRIMLYEAAPDSSADMSRKDIADINRISWRSAPSGTLERFRAFNNIPLKTLGLVLVTPNKYLRSIVYNCMDITQLSHAVYPQKKGFSAISTILPVGVPGGRPGVPARECRVDSKKNAGTTLLIAAVDRDNAAELRIVADRFYERTGIRLSFKTYSAGELVKLLFKRPHPYDMVPIMYSVVQPEYETFFKDFSVKDGFLDYDLPLVLRLRKELLGAEDDQKKLRIINDINSELVREAVVLPLFQEVRKFYYPAEIKNLLIGKGFTEYPEVADFRW